MDETTSDDLREASIRKLAELLQDMNVAMLTTVASDGSLRSRPMATQQGEFDGDLWFFTRASSGKVHEVEEQSRVNLAYAEPSENSYVSVSGRAELVRDRSRIEDLWSPIYLTWFPSGLEDPELALIRVEVEAAEYWDAPSSRLVQLAGFVKALATGKPYNGGEHAKVTL
jgi:general stress protein 26